MRMSPRIRLDTRWVWPTIIASTVVSWSWSAMPEDRAVPRHARRRCRSGCRPFAVPWWITTTWTLTPCFLRRCDSALIRGRLVEEREPRGGAGRDEVGRGLQLGADDADLDAVDVEHDRRLDPRRAPCRSPSRRCWWRGTGSWREPVREEPVDAVVELVVAVGRRVQAPGVLDVDRRHVVEQERVGRRGADVVAAGQDQARTGQARELLVEHGGQVRRPADRDVDVVVADDRRSGRAGRGSR